MALSEFFPYGAPEQLDGAASRMARSTMGASFGVTLLVLALGAALSRGFTTLPTISGEPDIFMWEPPPGIVFPEPQVHPDVRPAPPRTDPSAIPVPVPDAIAPEVDVNVPVMHDGPAGDGPASGAWPGAQVGKAPVPGGADPAPGEYVAVDELPALARCAEPRYPDLARQAGVEGKVNVLILVGLDGRARRAIIAPGGSVPMLDEAALDAARTCVFTPALANGHPVKVWVSRQYRFTLH